LALWQSELPSALFIKNTNTRFANKNVNKMFTMDESYALLEKFLTDEKIYLVRDLDFATICKWLDVPVKKLEKRVFDELGLTGDGLLCSYRQGWPAYLEKKYGIKL
jgi:predicted hydrolase (HD superfamily)